MHTQLLVSILVSYFFIVSNSTLFSEVRPGAPSSVLAPVHSPFIHTQSADTCRPLALRWCLVFVKAPEASTSTSTLVFRGVDAGLSAWHESFTAHATTAVMLFPRAYELLKGAPQKQEKRPKQVRHIVNMNQPLNVINECHATL